MCARAHLFLLDCHYTMIGTEYPPCEPAPREPAPPEPIKDQVFQLRLTTQDKARLMADAAEAGKTLAQHIRDRMLSDDPAPHR
jgi:hypothetical protein